VREDIVQARTEQKRVRAEFKQAFQEGLVCAGFERGSGQAKYLLFAPENS
jgi:hypothetical protein